MLPQPYGVPVGSDQAPGSLSLRSLSRARIIWSVRRRPGVTRVELSRHTGLSKTTVSTVVSELLDQGFLYEDGEDPRQRKTSLYLNRDAGVAVGCEVRPGEARAILADMSMRILRRCVCPLPNNLVQTTIDTLVDMHSELLAGIALPCLGTVVALPGPTDKTGQVLRASPNMGWTDVPIGRLLSEALQQPASVVNVPRAMAVGEYWYGAGGGAHVMILMNISSGIGAGILVGGQTYLGAHGFSAEIGHTTIVPDGPLCACGNRGCLEQLANVPAILARVFERCEEGDHTTRKWRDCDLDGPAAYAQLVAAALDGDPVVVDAVREASQYIGIAVANLVDLFNPNLVVIGGPLAEVGELLISGIRETARRRAFHTCFDGVEIVRSRLGADAAGVGACTMVMERYFAEAEPSAPTMQRG